jgi:hypothetical protein
MIEKEVAREFPPDSDLSATVDDSYADEPDTLGWYAHMHAAIRAVGDQVKTDWRETERRAPSLPMAIIHGGMKMIRV